MILGVIGPFFAWFIIILTSRQINLEYMIYLIVIICSVIFLSFALRDVNRNYQETLDMVYYNVETDFDKIVHAIEDALNTNGFQFTMREVHQTHIFQKIDQRIFLLRDIKIVVSEIQPENSKMVEIGPVRSSNKDEITSLIDLVDPVI